MDKSVNMDKNEILSRIRKFFGYSFNWIEKGARDFSCILSDEPDRTTGNRWNFFFSE